MLDINEDALKIAAEKVKSEFGQPVLAIHCNIGDKKSVEAAAQAVKDANMPPVGAVANVAGIASPSSFLDLSLEEWNRVYAINCTGSFLVCQAFIPQMIAGGYGRIVNMSSVTAQHGEGRRDRPDARTGTRVRAVWHHRQRDLPRRGRYRHPRRFDT
jgi:2-hydroxycyclohexanecarboxyl-CoA dehydrogenase